MYISLTAKKKVDKTRGEDGKSITAYNHSGGLSQQKMQGDSINTGFSLVSKYSVSERLVNDSGTIKVGLCILNPEGYSKQHV